MKIHEIIKTLDAQVICGEEFIERDVEIGCACDLMSHVLSRIKYDHTLLLTGLATPQVIYAADAVDVSVICFVRGQRPDDKTIQLASERGMVLLATRLPMFESCGRLYRGGLIGSSQYEK